MRYAAALQRELLLNLSKLTRYVLRAKGIMMRTKKRLIGVTISIFMIVSTISANKVAVAETQIKKIAILEFKANNTSESFAHGVRDILEVNLYKTEAFEILERDQVDLILNEHGYHDKWCSESSCAIKIGEMLLADKIIVGSISKIGSFTISIKFVDVRKGHVEYADSEIAASENEIGNSIEKLAKRVSINVAELQKEKSVQDPSIEYKYSPYGYYLRGVFPGWAQMYAGKSGKGVIFMSAFIIAGSFAGYAAYDYKKKRKEYDDLTFEVKSEFDSKHEDSDRAFRLRNVALGVVAAIYVINWVDILDFSVPNFNEVNNAGLYIQGDNFVSINSFGGGDSPQEINVSAVFGIRF